MAEFQKFQLKSTYQYTLGAIKIGAIKVIWVLFFIVFAFISSLIEIISTTEM